MNTNLSFYLGLPAAPNAGIVPDMEMDLQPIEAQTIIQGLQCQQYLD